MFRPHVKIPVGSYVDVPDDTGTLQRWLVIINDNQPQFPMYYILKCNWVLKWAYEGKVYKCECVQRTQSSYNSGLWTDYMFTSPEDQTIMWLPTTPYTQTLSYNQRVLINDAGRRIPIVWELSKVLDTIPVGITRLTFKQVQADLHADCSKYGLANFCPYQGECDTCKLAEPTYIDAGLDIKTEEIRLGKITYNGKDSSIRVGGSAKTLTAMFLDSNSNEYVSKPVDWHMSFVDGNNVLCSVDITNESKPGDIVCNGSDGKEIFKINVSRNGDSLKVKCLPLYSMVGKAIVVSALGTEKLKMEVVS